VVGSLAIALAALRVRPSSILAVLVCHVFCDGLSHVMVLLSSLKTRSQNPNTDGQLPDASTALAYEERSRLKAATADDARRYAWVSVEEPHQEFGIQWVMAQLTVPSSLSTARRSGAGMLLSRPPSVKAPD